MDESRSEGICSGGVSHSAEFDRFPCGSVGVVPSRRGVRCGGGPQHRADGYRSGARVLLQQLKTAAHPEAVPRRSPAALSVKPCRGRRPETARHSRQRRPTPRAAPSRPCRIASNHPNSPYPQKRRLDLGHLSTAASTAWRLVNLHRAASFERHPPLKSRFDHISTNRCSTNNRTALEPRTSSRASGW